jgi:hypothetical protein
MLARAVLPAALSPGLPILLLAAGCAAPAPIVRLHPRDADVVWDAGRAVVARADTGVRVAVAFERQSQGMLAVRLEVANDTDARIDVQPHDVTYATCKTDAVATCAPAAWVIDPEVVLDSLDVQHSLQTATMQNDASYGAALVLLGAVGDIGAAAHGHSAHAQNTAAAADVAASTSARNAATIERIEGEQVRWADAFRRTTLLPGQGVGGPIYIPIVPDAHLVWLQVKVGERKFLFSFSQEVRRLVPVDPDAPGGPWRAGPVM